MDGFIINVIKHIIPHTIIKGCGIYCLYSWNNIPAQKAMSPLEIENQPSHPDKICNYKFTKNIKLMTMVVIRRAFLNKYFNKGNNKYK